MLARASRILLTLFVTRVSGAHVYGLFVLATAVADIASRISIFGMDKSLLVFIPKTAERDASESRRVLSASFRIALLLGGVASAVLFCAGPSIGAGLLDEPALGPPLRIIALSILPFTFLTLFLSATKALKIMSYDALVSGLVFPLLLLLCATPIIWIDRDVVWLTAAYAITTVVAAGIALLFFARHWSVMQSFIASTKRTLRPMVRFSTPLALHDGVQLLGARLELFILAFFVGPAEIGIYAVAVELATVIRQTLDPILIPLVAGPESEADKPRVEAHLSRAVRWILIVGSIYVAAVLLFGEPLLEIFGPGFSRGVTALIVLATAHAVNAAMSLVDSAMMASGRPHVNLLNALAFLGVHIGLSLYLVPRYGIVGAAVSVLASVLILAAVRVGQSLLVLKLNPFSASQLKPIVAALAAVIAVVTLKSLVSVQQYVLLPLLLVTFALTAILVLRLLGLEEEDRDLIARVLNRVRLRT
jgi:O-antigen/teichoic acid export membrane protein